MSHYFAVVVEAGPDLGNMAASIDTYILTPEEDAVRPLVDVSLEFALGLRSQVFHVGEILILDESGREVGYPGRKPSKWGVGIEEFGQDLDAAVARAWEVFAESQRSPVAKGDS